MFQHDDRLGISIPVLTREWTEYPLEKQQQIMHKWEAVRGIIPDRIQQLEKCINEKQAALNNEENFIVSCRLNTEISELASIINDLWLWFRTVPDVHPSDPIEKRHS
ncbi:hypothetical protein [Domibacillus epiphyticus]|uniref:Uncharacterized protein n=1 Tax=Domibacillus epiphyticus TaxID=1714355 RepID=A0A1V2A8Y9_9BACI|nr:hypothetical protein [Domibacillus epiphyticus]OMP67453.1 hypothetical protein BTO28_05760 [Domibacillus epiphyticus]